MFYLDKNVLILYWTKNYSELLNKLLKTVLTSSSDILFCN